MLNGRVHDDGGLPHAAIPRANAGTDPVSDERPSLDAISVGVASPAALPEPGTVVLAGIVLMSLHGCGAPYDAPPAAAAWDSSQEKSGGSFPFERAFFSGMISSRW